MPVRVSIAELLHESGRTVVGRPRGRAGGRVGVTDGHGNADRHSEVLL